MASTGWRTRRTRAVPQEVFTGGPVTPNGTGSTLVRVLADRCSLTARTRRPFFVAVTWLVLFILAGIVCHSVRVVAFKPADSSVSSEPIPNDKRSPAEEVVSDNVRRRVIPSRRQKSVLVTGAAGFIGFHLASALAGGHHDVIGIDNFNDYYDVRLKHARADTLLKSRGVVVHRADVCDEERLRSIMTSHEITHVVHLAAQAGVRFSIVDPLSYVTANVECFTKLLELLEQFPAVKLVYASSSSVYGSDAPVPFAMPWPLPTAVAGTAAEAVLPLSADEAPTHRSDSTVMKPGELVTRSVPNNMYAATKLTGELLATVHCNKRLRNIRLSTSSVLNTAPIGLRFFTVYGPWGRPDMAVYGFAEAMMTGKSIRLFQAKDDQVMSRDFTYVDDIVSGILAAMDYEPSTCGEIFNLGLGQPASVPEMIRILENELNLTASIVKVPLPPTELMQTFADISDSQLYLNFEPKTDLRKGIRSFVEWLRSYKRNVSDCSGTL